MPCLQALKQWLNGAELQPAAPPLAERSVHQAAEASSTGLGLAWVCVLLPQHVPSEHSWSSSPAELQLG